MKTSLVVACSALIGCIAAACGVDSRDVSTGESAAGASAAVGSDGATAGGSAGMGAEGASGAAGLEPANLDCAGQVREAPPGEVGFFISLDVSGSMLDLLPLQGITKWEAVRASVASFVEAVQNDRVALGIGFFPQRLPGVPDACTSNDECGRLGGPCSNSLCVVDGTLSAEGTAPLSFVRLAQSGARNCFDAVDCSGTAATCRAITGECVFPGDSPDIPGGSFLNVAADATTEAVSPLCETQADCAGLPGTVCEPVGFCANQAIQCTASIGCPPEAGECTPVQSGCLNQTRCDVPAYAAPTVAIGTDNTPAILDALVQQLPAGLTPTAPALDGAITHARSWVVGGSPRRAVIILATDGFPTQCAPLEIPDIAETLGAAASGPSAIRTFVVGVFSDEDLGVDGRARLDTLATSGNTGRAFIINTSANVDAELSQALRSIQNQISRCEIPLGASTAADAALVNVEIIEEGATRRRLINVADVAACTSDGSAWYYASGTTAGTQINLCPSTCERLAVDERLELREGCPMLRSPP